MRRLLPRAADYRGLLQGWRGDVVAGITVGVVALPLALAFGITTGLGAQAGLITAIVAGLVAAVFGGSNVQVSGPTGAMTVVLVPIVERYGTDAVLVVAMMAGILVIAAAFAKVGRYLAYVPWPVVEGFTVGIAILIFLQQVPSALGVPKPEGENSAAIAFRAVRSAIAGDGVASAMVLVVVALLVMLLVPRIRRSLPASLIAVAVATVAARVLDLDAARIGELPSSLPLPSLPSTSFGEISDLASAAVAVALLAAIESLLSAKVADGMTDTSPHDPDRELFGQGLANVVSPLFGGMPATGAIARTAVNVRSGARTRAASIVHSLVLVAVVFLASDLVAEIPLAALAGVLIMTAFRMVEVHNVRAVVRSTRSDAITLVLTMAATVAFDLIVAIEVGVAVAALLALRHIARNAEAAPEPLPVLYARPERPTHTGETADTIGDREVTPDSEAELLQQRILVYRLDGALFFGAAQRFLTELTAVTDARVVILRMSHVQVLDATGAQALGEIVRELENRGITVLIKGVQPRHLKILAAVGTLDRLRHENHLFATLDDAVAHARRHAGTAAQEPLAHA